MMLKTTSDKLLEIAKKHSQKIRDREDLERKKGSADSVSVPVWRLKKMLEDAYTLGHSDALQFIEICNNNNIEVNFRG